MKYLRYIKHIRVNYNIFISLIVGFLLVQCAQPGSITGGDRDIAPPKVLRWIPNHLSTQYQGSEFLVEFDEYVKVGSLSSNLVVSPPLKYPLTYKMKGKRIYFEIQDTLKPNSTYIFNFGNAIADLNEGNILDSNLWVISTGKDIDSGSIHGTIIDSYTQKPVEGAYALLYSQTKDSAIYNGSPQYVAKSNAQGQYTLRFIGEHEYKIFAINTSNAGYAYTPFNPVGFQTELVHPDKKNPIDIDLFVERDTLQLMQYEKSKIYYTFTVGFKNDLTKPIFTFSPAMDSIHYLIEEIEADSLAFWIPGDLEMDTVQFRVYDAATGYRDTTTIQLADRELYKKKLRKRDKKHDALKIGLNTSSGVLNYFEQLYVKFERPITHWNIDSIAFVDESDTTLLGDAIESKRVKFAPEIKTKGTTKELRSSLFEYEWKPDTKYALILYAGAFTDILRETNDTLILKFNTLPYDQYGSFMFTITTPEYSGPLVLEKINNNNEVVTSYSLRSGDVINDKLAIPGVFQMRIIFDQNGNGIWDTGDIGKEIQPEKIVYYKEKITIRSNWDLEEIWNIDIE